MSLHRSSSSGARSDGPTDTAAGLSTHPPSLAPGVSMDASPVTVTVLVSASSSAAAASSSSPSVSSSVLPLRHRWCFWFDDGNYHARSSVGSGSADFLRHLVLLGSFDSIASFWRYVNSVDLNIHRICRHGRFNLRLFKEGVPPVWDHPTQASGGRWVMKATPSSDMKKTRDIWFELLMAVVGEQLPLAESIAGCVLACKPHQNEVQLWVAQPPYQTAASSLVTAAHTPEEAAAAADEARQLDLVNQQAHDLRLKSIAHTMRRVLRLTDSTRISYIPHSYEAEKARASEADHVERERQREERRKLKAVQNRASKSQTWPIRPPEEFMQPLQPTAGTHAATREQVTKVEPNERPERTRREEETLDESRPQPSRDADPSHAGGELVSPATTSPSVDPRLLAAMSLSANPLHDEAYGVSSRGLLTDDAEMGLLLGSPARVARREAITSDSTPPSGPPSGQKVDTHAATSPADFQRFMIARDHASIQQDAARGDTVGLASPSTTTGLSADTLHGPLASLLGLTPTRPSQLMPTLSSSTLLSPASAPPAHSPTLLVHLPAVPDSSSLVALASSVPAPLPWSTVPSSASSSASSSSSAVHTGVHVLNSQGRPAALTSTSHLNLPSSGHMSRAERRQAQQWLDRVQNKQEQAKSWPRALLPTPVPTHGPRPTHRPINVNAANGQYLFSPQPVPVSGVTQAATHRVLPAGATHPVVASMLPIMPPNVTSSNTELVRSRTEHVRSRPGSVGKMTPGAARVDAPINLTASGVAANAPPAASASPAAPANDASASSGVCVGGVAAPLSLSLSPTATQVYSSGVLPVLQLGECSPHPVPSPTRPRSRSLFWSGQMATTSRTASPLTTTLVSPLLTAFKDVNEAAIAAARHTATGQMLPPAALSVSTDSPPLLHLPSPAATLLKPFHLPDPPISIAMRTPPRPVLSSLHLTGDGAALEYAPVASPDVVMSPSLVLHSPLDPDLRLELGLPPIPPNGPNAQFKPMSRAERKQALAMLSKVTSKRKQAQSWPRSMLLAANTNNAHAHAHGQTLSPVSSVSPKTSQSPDDGSTRASPTKPNAAANLTVDMRAIQGGGAHAAHAAPSPIHTRAVSSAATAGHPSHHPFSPHPASTYHTPNPLLVHSPMSSLMLPLHRSISAGETYGHASGATTPSGAHTPGGRAVTLGMGLRSRTKPNATQQHATSAAMPPRTPPPHARQISTGKHNTGATSPAAGHATTTNHATPFAIGRKTNSPPVTQTIGGSPSTVAAGGSPAPHPVTVPSLAPAVVVMSPAVVLSPSVVMPLNAGMTAATPIVLQTAAGGNAGAGTNATTSVPFVLPTVTNHITPHHAPPSLDASPNRPLYIIIGLLTLLLIVMTLLLLKTRDEAQLSNQLQLLLENRAQGFVAANHPAVPTMGLMPPPPPPAPTQTHAPSEPR